MLKDHQSTPPKKNKVHPRETNRSDAHKVIFSSLPVVVLCGCHTGDVNPG